MKNRHAGHNASAKIIISMDGAVLREIALSSGRATIGRQPQNHIVLNDLGVSGRHALIATTDNDFYLEDLNSTNGTQVNGQPVGKHFLQHGDIIGIARYQLRYVNSRHAGRASLPTGMEANAGGALVRVLEGVGAGREIPLNKPITTLGRPDAQIAVILRQPGGYLLAQVEGAAPLVNGAAIAADGRFLDDGDLIEMGGARLRFMPVPT